jgi:hypothetical protein
MSKNDKPDASLTRREALSRMGRYALAVPALLTWPAQYSCGGRSSSSTPPPPPPPQTDDQFLDSIEQACFKFFWNESSAQTGQVRDRARSDGTGTTTVSSIAATGFGLTALCIADSRGYRPSAEIKQRVVTTLQFLLNTALQVNGFFYHFIDMNTGARAYNSEVSSIDTSLLLGGVLTARQYYASDPLIPSLATQIYQRVNWQWMQNGASALSMGWTPESGFITSRWDAYCELMIIYLLGMGSTTYPLPTASWNAFTRPQFQYGSYRYINISAPLFIHQYSHAWFDFRGKKDSYADYFQNSVIATQAHKSFCISLANQYRDYADNLWGISASDSASGYVVWGGPPAIGPIDGSIVPSAAGGSLVFVPVDCIADLRHIKDTYPNAWTQYGFVDAFNPLTGWYDTDVLGIDAGITMLMAENQRTQFVWKTFMKNPEAVAAMAAAGFAGY